MTRLFATALFYLISTFSVFADSPVPDRRLIVTEDVDFYGSDLQALFDTTLDACQNQCLSDTRCVAFTFNSRSNSCFPKTGVTDRQEYEGAVSAVVVQTAPGALQRAEARADELGFLSSSDLRRALDQADGLGRLHPAGKWSVEVLLDAVQDRRSKNNLPAAIHWMGGVVSQTDASDQWLDYARLMLEIKSSNSSEVRRYRSRALSASVNAYLRSAPGAQQVSALSVMADALEENGRGRDMIPALRLAQSIRPRDDLARALDDAIGKYGFRIMEHRVESDLASPRICAEFNEPLVKAGIDYEPFVQRPSEGLVVEPSGRQICVSGLDHGARVRLVFREGLPAASGETLAKDIEITGYIRDRAPSVRFPGRSYVLPRSADAGLPVETVNTETLDLTLRRVSDRNLLRAMQDRYFGKPLSYWELREFGSDISEEIWKGTGQVEMTLNRDMTTRLPLGDVIKDQPPGIYALSAAVPGTDPYDDPGATQWFILTDLGVTTLTGTDGLHVFVRGLSNAETREGAKVTLISRANRVLGTATTDAQGYARFEAGLTRGTGGSAPALVTVTDGAENMAFLSLTDPSFDLSDRGVEGREPAPAIDMFLATDRGAYRAGETIHVTALARDGEAKAISGLPVTAILTRPDGVEHSRVLSGDDTAGGHVFHLPLSSTVPRGAWRIDLKADPQAPALASRSVLVEDFLPERIDFDITLPDGVLRATDLLPVAIEAKYLFGAPGADLPVSGELRLTPKRSHADWPGYLFGRHDARFDTRSDYFIDGARTNVDGLLRTTAEFPSFGTQPDRPMDVEVRVSVSEGSGRPVERRVTREVAPFGDVIGIRPLFDGVVSEGTEAVFNVIGLNSRLQPQPMQVKWTLNRVRTRYQWYQQYGDWNWEPITTRTEVAGGTATLGADPFEVSAPVDWGRYELVVERTDGSYVAASEDFYAGWYAPADASSTPDTLELSLDKPGYVMGETARLRLVPRYAGKALITVMSNRLIAMKAVDVVEGENLIPLEVTDEWGAGAYVTAQVIRAMDEPSRQNPARALGLSYAKIDPGAKQLSVQIETDSESDPRGPLSASVVVDGVTEGETAFVTLAAVDVGILNLTGFQSPDPSDHYFGQRRLGMEIRDIYGRLIDGMNGAMGQVRSGGDAADSMRMQSPPPTEELVAYFSGPIEVGPDGRASASFDIPDFNGTVRLMAVAWSPTSVGQAQADVLVRDPVVVTASLPRFLSPGDQSRMLLEIVHATGPSGRMGLDIVANGLTLEGNVPSGFDLGPQQKQTYSIPLVAGDEGDHAIRIALTTPDGRQLTKDLTLGVRANDPVISATRRFSLGAGDTLTLDDNVFAGLRRGSASAMMSAGPLARFDAPGLLSSLDRYPYGCTEQVTSRALPMLYMSSVAQALGLGNKARLDLRISQSVERVLTRQASNGAFGLWRAESGDFWLDAYVSDFLSRARAQGYSVPDLAFRNAMDNLRNRINYAPDFDDGGEDIAYALMVLAREGAAAMGDLRYYADVKSDAFATPMALAQLGAALASYGDQTRADRMFAKAAARLERRVTSAPVWRVDYGTSLRDTAGLLSLAVEAGSQAIDRNALVSRISAPYRALSTQEQAWSLLAAHAMVQDPSMSGFLVNGAPVDGPMVKVVQGSDPLPMTLTNSGNTATDVTLTTFGQPNEPVEKAGYGYNILRSYYTMEGVPIQGAVQTGDRMVVVLRISPAERVGARLMINDPLPAGLEIDNPNLLRSGDIRALNWLKTVNARHTEFRSDRFLAAVDWRSDKSFELAYIVRAVSPGDYHHPAASVEDMYRPDYRARTGSGRFVVIE